MRLTYLFRDHNVFEDFIQQRLQITTIQSTAQEVAALVLYMLHNEGGTEALARKIAKDGLTRSEDVTLTARIVVMMKQICNVSAMTRLRRVKRIPSNILQTDRSTGEGEKAEVAGATGLGAGGVTVGGFHVGGASEAPVVSGSGAATAAQPASDGARGSGAQTPPPGVANEATGLTPSPAKRVKKWSEAVKEAGSPTMSPYGTPMLGPVRSWSHGGGSAKSVSSGMSETSGSYSGSSF
ncbi:hypothetical protein A0H81_06594 [Grifola frondosa]|uniref:Uncharacterized protein n=1 Tax=Grifola frondosa TaxID=5627 RepID=A0A1C7M8W4_GRIFR|nr:hypothetical protein A0H81_06594 [Grifola frondosa]